MILRFRRGWAPCALIPLLFSGCATTKVDSDPSAFTRDEAPAELESTGTTAPLSDEEPGWRRVLYSGKIAWRDSEGAPIPGAIVSVCDGDEVYHSTLTDERGNFEFPVDLYGTPGRGSWEPETYYVLLVRAPSGEWTKKRLREFETGKPLNVQLERSRS